jgi:Ca2+-binding RTX toxin-like protein
VTRLVAAALVFTAFALAPAPAAAVIGPFTGTATGLLDRYRHIDTQGSPESRVVSDSKDIYKARFTYRFEIDDLGNISGSGTGDYTSATWHLEGTNGEQGSFSCDVPMTVGAFKVRVTGRAGSGKLLVRFTLDGARESNQDHYCGAGYWGYASDSTRLADSLELVQPPDGLAADQADPAFEPLSRLETLGDDRDRRVNLHEWSLTIAAPDTPQDAGGDTAPGTARDPDRAGAGGDICTIDGSAGRDRLQGTAGNDIICGYGGGDVIDGAGGQDLIYGGLGNDRITGGAGRDVMYGNAGRDRFRARDRTGDRLHGGSGRDRARADRRIDRLRSVERRD